MPIHFSDLDVIAELDGVRSALIVPCNMCPAVTVAVRERKPFMQLFKGLLTSTPFERYIKSLEARLVTRGVETEVFKSRFYHQWFMCMWTADRRAKLRKRASQHDAVVVLGCDSATETVREAADACGCKVIEGMTVSGIMNARVGFHLPGSITFDNCRIVPISGEARTAGVAD